MSKLTEKQKLRDSRIISKLINKCDTQKDYSGAVRYFLKQKEKLSDRAYWEALRAIWITCGKRENYMIFKRLFGSSRSESHWAMTDRDRDLLSGMPEKIEIYRAIHADEDYGISWTTSKSFVNWYAEMKGREVVSRVVGKADIFAYLTSRNEDEVILKEALI